MVGFPSQEVNKENLSQQQQQQNHHPAPKNRATLPEPSKEIESYVRESFIKALQNTNYPSKVDAINATVDDLLTQVGHDPTEAPTRACIYHRAILSFTPNGELQQFVNDTQYINYCLKLATTIGTYNVYEAEHIFRTLKDQKVGRHDSTFYCEWAKFALSQKLPEKANKIIAKGLQVGATPIELLTDMMKIISDNEPSSHKGFNVVPETPSTKQNPLSRFPSTPAASFQNNMKNNQNNFLSASTPASKVQRNTFETSSNSNTAMNSSMSQHSSSGLTTGVNGLGMISESQEQSDTFSMQHQHGRSNNSFQANTNQNNNQNTNQNQLEFNAWTPGQKVNPNPPQNTLAPATPGPSNFSSNPRPHGSNQKPARVKWTPASSFDQLEHTQVAPGKLSPIKEESSLANTNTGFNQNTLSVPGSSSKSGRNSSSNHTFAQNNTMTQKTEEFVTAHGITAVIGQSCNRSSNQNNLPTASMCPSNHNQNSFENKSNDQQMNSSTQQSQNEILNSQQNQQNLNNLQSNTNNNNLEISNPTSQNQNQQNTLTNSNQIQKIIYVNGRPYRRVEELGRGGSSKVYKVADSNGCVFALKRVNCAGDPSVMETFIGEVDLLRKLSGKPRIIRMFDSEVLLNKRRLLILMEYGEMDLAKFCQSHKATCSNIRQLWRQMLEAVSVVHAERVWIFFFFLKF